MLRALSMQLWGLAGHYWQLGDPSHQQHLFQPQQNQIELDEELFGRKVCSMVLFLFSCAENVLGEGGSWWLCLEGFAEKLLVKSWF